MGGGGDDEDLLCPKKSSLSGQFAQQWKLHVMAQEAALKMAASKLRSLVAYNRSFISTDVKVGPSAVS